jgi:hypothetical protein
MWTKQTRIFLWTLVLVTVPVVLCQTIIIDQNPEIDIDPPHLKPLSCKKLLKLPQDFLTCAADLVSVSEEIYSWQRTPQTKTWPGMPPRKTQKHIYADAIHTYIQTVYRFPGFTPTYLQIASTYARLAEWRLNYYDQVRTCFEDKACRDRESLTKQEVGYRERATPASAYNKAISNLAIVLEKDKANGEARRLMNLYTTRVKDLTPCQLEALLPCRESKKR